MPTPHLHRRRTAALVLLLGLSACAAATGQALDAWGPPPDGDPSAWRGPSIGEEFAIDLLESLESTIEGALEGGDPEAETVIPEDDLRSEGVPTGGPPSPLFGAQPFEQRMLLFEEFGVDRLADAPPGTVPLPLPAVGPLPAQSPTSAAASSPPSAALDAFLADRGLVNAPTVQANTTARNPYEPLVEAFLGRPLEAPPAEGRPPGWGWAHQRFTEFYPQVYFKTVQAGARTNGGVRDARQRHGYAVGEFAPGGLYHRVYDTDLPSGPVVDGTTAGVGIRLHPNMPIQRHTSVWTFDGTLPPKLLMGRYGEPILFRHYNALPIDPSSNRGFGLHTLSTHEHNGHNPAESDGYANAFFFPGQYYDYRWPMQLAGYDTINTQATDPRAGMPCTPGEAIFVNDGGPGLRTCDSTGVIKLRGDYRETASTHWFHDHMLDFTAQNVYKGNAAMFNYYSAVDRGNEAHDDGVNLRLPSGTALSWGNRDYDVNLLIADKAWDTEGQLWFNIFNTNGFLGDQLTTNWLYKPFFEVRARKYRFRLLNGAVARYISVALVKEVEGTGGELPGPRGSGISYQRVGFHLIANDGNLLEHALPFDGTMDLDNDGDFGEHKGALPVQSIAERFDIIVDFASQGIVPGDVLYFVNTLEHETGRRPEDKIPLRDILSGAYAPWPDDDRWRDGDPAVGAFLELRVMDYDGADLSMNPEDYEPGGLQMVPLPIDREDPALQTARRRRFEFDRGGTDDAPWTIKTDGGAGLVADARRVSAAPQLATGPTEAGFDGANADGYDGIGTLEIWRVEGNGGWSHPVHVHFEEGVILSRDGQPPPAWERWARKDIFRIGPEEDGSINVEAAFHFREFSGTYVEHCHNTQHEDHAMLMRWDLEHPGQIQMMPSPIPTWDGVEYVDSHALPTFRTGEGRGPSDEIPASVDPPLLSGSINWPPVFSPVPSQDVRVGEVLSLPIRATDPNDGDLLTLAATRLPAGATFDPATGLLRWAPTNSDAGEHTLTFLVTDDGDPQRSATMSVTVRVEAAAPAEVSVSVFVDWGGGWCGDLQWTNTTPRPVGDWTLVVGLTGRVLSLWNGAYTAVPGGIEVSSAWYNATVPVGETLVVGVCVDGARPSSLELISPDLEAGDPDAPSTLATYEEWGRWGAASCGDVTIQNVGPVAFDAWTTGFSLEDDTRMSTYWLAEGGEVSPGRIELQDLGWNGRLDPRGGNTQGFGVCFDGPGEPTGFVVTGS